MTYRILPILPNEGAPHSLEEANSVIMFKIHAVSLTNVVKLESSESQLSPQNVRCDLANAPGALIRKNTVIC